jgi:hypothetical protein
VQLAAWGLLAACQLSTSPRAAAARVPSCRCAAAVESTRTSMDSSEGAERVRVDDIYEDLLATSRWYVTDDARLIDHHLGSTCQCPGSRKVLGLAVMALVRLHVLGAFSQHPRSSLS